MHIFHALSTQFAFLVFSATLCASVEVRKNDHFPQCATLPPSLCYEKCFGFPFQAWLEGILDQYSRQSKVGIFKQTLTLCQEESHFLSKKSLGSDETSLSRGHSSKYLESKWPNVTLRKQSLKNGLAWAFVIRSMCYVVKSFFDVSEL